MPDNAWYLDLSANYPINDAWTFNAHVGRQDYQGSTNGVSNNVFDYTDWKLGVTWAISGYNIGAYYTDTNAKAAGYTLAGTNIGRRPAPSSCRRLSDPAPYRQPSPHSSRGKQ